MGKQHTFGIYGSDIKTPNIMLTMRSHDGDHQSFLPHELLNKQHYVLYTVDNVMYSHQSDSALY